MLLTQLAHSVFQLIKGDNSTDTEFAIVQSGLSIWDIASSTISDRQRINCPKHSSMIQEYGDFLLNL